MVSFIILPAVLQLLPDSSGAGPQDIARTRYFGKVDGRTVAVLQDEQQQISGFYRHLYELLAPTIKEDQAVLLQGLAMRVQQMDQRQSSESLINDWLIVQYARKSGLASDPASIVDYLKELTGGLLSDAVFQQAIRDTGLSERRLMELLSSELVREQMMMSFYLSQNVVSPATRWDWFQRLNRNMTAEVAAVPIDGFLASAGEPTEAQLQQLFAERKNIPYNPVSAESGFVIPVKMAFQYVQAEPSQKTLDSITTDEITKYYEENKEADFRKPVRPITQPTLPTLPSIGGGIPFGAGSSAAPKTVVPVPVPPQEQKEATPPAETPTDVKKEAEEPTEGTKEAPQETVTETPSEAAAPEEEAPKEEPKENEGETSLLNRKVQTVFTAFQTEEPVKAVEEKKEEAKTENTVPAPQEETQTEDKPAVENKETEKKEEEKKADETPVDLSILYKPLSEVEGQIRQILALQKAQSALLPIEEKMREHFQAYNTNFDQGQAVPPMPDLTPFVEAQGLKLKTVALGTVYDAVKSEFARKTSEREFLIKLFNEGPVVFEPLKTPDAAAVLWITEIVNEVKPESIDEVKDIVTKQWKDTEAQPSALKKAEELAAEAKSSGKTLAETFKDRQDISVVETEPFAWKSYGPGIHPFLGMMQRLALGVGEVCEKGIVVGNSEIDNKVIFAPGNEFMKVASSLAVGEIGVAFNQPKTAAYIIRITGSTPSEDVLWEQFPSTNPMFYYQAGMQEQQFEALENWLEQIRQETGFEWIQKPEQ